MKQAFIELYLWKMGKTLNTICKYLPSIQSFPKYLQFGIVSLDSSENKLNGVIKA